MEDTPIGNSTVGAAGPGDVFYHKEHGWCLMLPTTHWIDQVSDTRADVLGYGRDSVILTRGDASSVWSFTKNKVATVPFEDVVLEATVANLELS